MEAPGWRYFAQYVLCLPPLATQTEEENFKESLGVASPQEDPVLGIDTTESAQNITRFLMYDSPWLRRDNLNLSDTHIHGYCNVPPGYTLSSVPLWVTFMESGRASRTSQTARLSYNYSSVKIMVSLGQAIYVIFILYRARGDQIAQFAYAAYGLGPWKTGRRYDPNDPKYYSTRRYGTIPVGSRTSHH